MEDRHVIIHDLNKVCCLTCPKQYSYYAVFDGHVGIQAANYCASHLHHHFVENQAFKDGDIIDALKVAFAKCDAGCLERTALGEEKTGTTAVVCVKEDNTCLYFAWAGDSQAIIVADGQAEDLTPAHKPSVESERKRITDLGGTVIHTDTWRVSGLLAVSRAIGDPDHKPFITSDPDTRVYELKGNEDFIVIACDGLWDSFSPDDVASHVFEYLASNSFSDPDEAASKTSQYLVEKAKKDGSTDNITAIVVFLRDIKQLLPTFASDTTGNFFEISDVNTCVAANQLSSTRVDVDESLIEESFATATGSDHEIHLKNTPATSFALLNENEDKMMDASFVTAGFASPFSPYDSTRNNLHPHETDDVTRYSANLIEVESSPQPPATLLQLSSNSIDTLEANSPVVPASPHTPVTLDSDAMCTRDDQSNSPCPSTPEPLVTSSTHDLSASPSPAVSSSVPFTENLQSLNDVDADVDADADASSLLTSGFASHHVDTTQDNNSHPDEPADATPCSPVIDEVASPSPLMQPTTGIESPPPPPASHLSSTSLDKFEASPSFETAQYTNPPVEAEEVTSPSPKLDEVSSPSPQPDHVSSSPFETQELRAPMSPVAAAVAPEDYVGSSPALIDEVGSPTPPVRSPTSDATANFFEISDNNPCVTENQPIPAPVEIGKPLIEDSCFTATGFESENHPNNTPATSYAPFDDNEDKVIASSFATAGFTSPLDDPTANNSHPDESGDATSCPSNLIEDAFSPPPATRLSLDTPEAFPSFDTPQNTNLPEAEQVTSPSNLVEVSSPPNLVEVLSPSPHPDQVVSSPIEVEEPTAPITPVSAAYVNEESLITSPSRSPDQLLSLVDPISNVPTETQDVASPCSNLVEVSSPSPQPAQVPSTPVLTEDQKSSILPVAAAVVGAVGVASAAAVVNKVSSSTPASRKPLVTSSTRKTTTSTTASTAGRTPASKSSAPLSRTTRSVASTSSMASSATASKARTTGTASTVASKVNGTTGKVNGTVSRVNGTSSTASRVNGTTTTTTSSSLLSKRVNTAPATGVSTAAKVNGVTKKSSAPSTASKVTGISSRLYPGPKTTTTSSSTTNGTAGTTVGPAVPKKPSTLASASTRSASSSTTKSTANVTSKTPATTTSSLQSSRVKTTTASSGSTSSSSRVTSTVASRLNGLSKSKITSTTSSTTDGKVNDKTGVTKKVTVTGVSSRLYPGPKTASTAATAAAKSTTSGR